MVCKDLIGFSVVCTDQDGGEHNLPAYEAITEYVAGSIGVDTGSYLSFNQRYRDGLSIIRQLNMDAGVSPKEFVAYSNGKQPFNDLLLKWGAINNKEHPDVTKAYRALIILGLLIDKTITKERADDYLKLVFGEL